MIPEKELLNEREVEKHFGVPVRTLQVWRNRGFGPAFVKAGRSVYYRPTDIEKFIEANIRTSTHDLEPSQN